MKKIVFIILCLVAINAYSQKRKTQFSITGEGAVMATKQAFTVYNAGFGGSGKVLFPTGKKNYFTTTFEIMSFSGRSGPATEIFSDIIKDPLQIAIINAYGVNVAHPSLTLFVPKVGYKYFFNKKLNGEAEFGYCIANVKKLFESIQGNIGGYDFSIGFGYMVSKKLDIGMRYEQFESTASVKDFTSFLSLRTLLNIDFGK